MDDSQTRPVTRSIGVVVTGDNHLSPRLPRYSPAQQAARRERLRAGFGAAVEYALAHGARLFVNTGDLFDSPTPTNQDRAYVADALNRLRAAGIVCIAIGGNHDTPRMLTESGGASPQAVYTALDGLQYFSANDRLIPHLSTMEGLRVAIAGLTNNPVAPLGSDPLAGVAVEDAEGALAQADVGLLIVHAAIAGLCRPNEGERIIAEGSLAALPPIFRVVVAGHIHRFARRRLGEREVVVVGATERMEFGASSGHAGFVWLELDATGARRVEHIRIEEQPRADLLLTTARLWPTAHTRASADAIAHDASAGGDSKGAVKAGAMGGGDDDDPMAPVRAAIAAECGPETITRLRLVGPLTRAQHQRLPIRDILLYGQEHTFAFDLDTTGLSLVDPSLPRAWFADADVAPDAALDATADAAPDPAANARHALSPAAEIERLAAEWLAPHIPAAPDSAATANTPTTTTPQASLGLDPEDVRAAAELLLGRLRGVG
jgi:hypothetical protein